MLENKISPEPLLCSTTILDEDDAVFPVFFCDCGKDEGTSASAIRKFKFKLIITPASDKDYMFIVMGDIAPSEIFCSPAYQAMKAEEIARGIQPPFYIQLKRNERQYRDFIQALKESDGQWILAIATRNVMEILIGEKGDVYQVLPFTRAEYNIE